MGNTYDASTEQATARPDHDRLFELASEQAGYFTPAQALACGFSRPLLSLLTRSGRYRHIRHGLYRIRAYPSSPHEEVMAAWLSAGRDVAFVSHESALDLLELSDVSPNAVHLTVPFAHRKLRPRSGVKIHTTIQPIPRGDQVIRHGIRLTGVIRTILDSAEWGTAPEQIEMAIAQAVRRGLARPTEVWQRAQERGGRVARLVRRALDQVES